MNLVTYETHIRTKSMIFSYGHINYNIILLMGHPIYLKNVMPKTKNPPTNDEGDDFRVRPEKFPRLTFTFVRVRKFLFPLVPFYNCSFIWRVSVCLPVK